MHYRVAVEDIERDHHVAWVLDLFGCFSKGRDHEGAIAAAPSRIADYYAWVAGHDPMVPTASGPFEVEVQEVFESYASDDTPGYLVNAFFEDDHRLLSYWDVVVGLKLLEWTRQDLMEVLRRLSPHQLHESIGEGQGQTIASIVEHVAQGENWYFGHFDLAVEWSSLPENAIRKLEAVRTNTRNQLVRLIGEVRVVESCGEKWSARKVLRRTLWHERDHTQHIAGLATHFA